MVAGALVTVFVFDTTGEEEGNTGEPSVRVLGTSGGRTVTLIREGEVGKVIIQLGNDTYNLTEVGSSVTIESRIEVNGRYAPEGFRGGAGGSVLVNATTISGSGNISADGGDGKANGFSDQGGGGCGGRVAIVGDTFSGNVSVDGGFGPKKAENGSDGTYYNP